MPNPTGWYEDPAAVEATTIVLGGDSCLWGSSNIKGYAAQKISEGVYGSFLWQAEESLYGQVGDPFYQKRGTCVAQAVARMVQDTWYNRLLLMGEIGRKVRVAVAPIYSIGRMEIGKGKIRGDGLVGAWAVRGLKKFGILERKVVGPYDLSQYDGDEKFAVDWGSRGTPKAILDELGSTEIVAYRCMTGQDMADAIYAKKAVMFCGKYTINNRDSNGYTRLNLPANHCIEVRGAAVSPGGNLFLGGQQSWGPNKPSGPRQLNYKGGSITVPDGVAFAPAEDWTKELSRTGEAWAIDFVPGKGFR